MLGLRESFPVSSELDVGRWTFGVESSTFAVLTALPGTHRPRTTDLRPSYRTGCLCRLKTLAALLSLLMIRRQVPMRLARHRTDLSFGELDASGNFLLGSVLKYSAMSRCSRLFVSSRREERAYPYGSVTDEQRRRNKKEAPPGGRDRIGWSGGVASSLSRRGGTADMLLTRASPSDPRRSRAALLGISTGF
jgi:hypothetical protein